MLEWTTIFLGQNYFGLKIPTSLTNAPSNRPGTLGGAFGGAVAGSALPASFLGGYGTMIGAGLGGLGLI